MRVKYDEAKRATTLHERGLDFSDVTRVLDGPALVVNSIAAPIMASRELSSMGMLDGRAVLRVWTPHGKARRIISMRYVNERERKNF